METEVLEVCPRVLVLEKNLYGRQIIERFQPVYVSEAQIEEMVVAHTRGETSELYVSSVTDFKENIFLVGTHGKHDFISLAHWNSKEGWRKTRWPVDGRQFLMGTRVFIR